eukprot:gene14262-14156_t
MPPAPAAAAVGSGVPQPQKGHHAHDEQKGPPRHDEGAAPAPDAPPPAPPATGGGRCRRQ